jgi:pyrroline-5-carboxylate reductase
MPNRPALVASGITGLMGDSLTEEVRMAEVESLFQAAGETVILDNEEQFDAVTGLSGSGPGFVFRMIEGLVEGGIREGLSREVSLKLAVLTVRGAGDLIHQLGTSPGTERKAVSSPNGTTVAGLAALDERGFVDSVIAAVQAAAARSRELGR